MTTETLAAMLIKEAWVCVQCDSVMNRNQCPWCLSRNTGALAYWLNHPTQEEKDDAALGGYILSRLRPNHQASRLDS